MIPGLAVVAEMEAQQAVRVLHVDVEQPRHVGQQVAARPPVVVAVGAAVCVSVGAGAWTCAYTFDPVSVPEATQIELAGCDAAAGAGVGPVDVTYPGSQEVFEQASTVVFTNTFTTTPLQPIQPAAQVVAQPTFTG